VDREIATTCLGFLLSTSSNLALNAAMRFPLFLLLPLLGLPTGSFAETYPIEFNRPFVQGQQFRYAASGKMKMSNEVSASGKLLTNSHQLYEGSLEAIVTIDSVKQGGIADELGYRIQSINASIDGKPVEAIQPGAVVVVKEADTGNATYWLGDKSLDGDLTSLLGMLLTSFSFENAMDQQVLGPDSPKAIGDEWKIDPAGFVALMAQSKMKVDPATVNGNAKLSETVDSSVGKALALEFAVAARAANGPSGLELTGSEISIAGSLLLPVDSKQQVPRESATITMELEGTAKSEKGATRQVVISIQQENSMTFEPIAD